jgi:hypothetical protein
VLTNRVPSGAERTVPIECEVPFDGMQSTSLLGVGHTPLTRVPRMTSESRIWLLALSFKRRSCDTVGASASGPGFVVEPFTSYV